MADGPTLWTLLGGVGGFVVARIGTFLDRRAEDRRVRAREDRDAKRRAYVALLAELRESASTIGHDRFPAITEEQKEKRDALAREQTRRYVEAASAVELVGSLKVRARLDDYFNRHNVDEGWDPDELRESFRADLEREMRKDLGTHEQLKFPLRYRISRWWERIKPRKALPPRADEQGDGEED